MKKLSLVLVALLIGASSFSQTIKVTVTEAQIFGKFGVHDNNTVINTPDENRGKKQVDCDYIFDLQEKTSTFISRSKQGIDNVLPIQNITKKGDLYIFEIATYNRYAPEYDSYLSKIYLNIQDNTMLYTWYDPYFDRSFVQQDHKIKITISGAQ